MLVLQLVCTGGLLGCFADLVLLFDLFVCLFVLVAGCLAVDVGMVC